MAVLLIRLAAPMQSWGAGSRYTRRETENAPTKSGVIGMIAAALGIPRWGSLERFRGLRFGVRIDQPGTLLSDYHTAKNDRGEMLPLSRRYYLQDAVFLAGLESEDTRELDAYRRALTRPYYPLFLGRRSCPPDGPLRTWLLDQSLEDALQNIPWQAEEWYQRRALRGETAFPERCFATVLVEPSNDADGVDDARESGGFVDELADEPVSFDPRRRRWESRRIGRLADDIRPAPTVSVPTGQSERQRETAQPSVFDGDAIFTAVASTSQGERS